MIFLPLGYADALQLRGCVKLVVWDPPGWEESQGVVMATAATKDFDIPARALDRRGGGSAM